MEISSISSRMQPDPTEMFKKLDSNGDGGIDQAEFSAAAPKKDSAAAAKSAELFAKIDTSGDGKIDAAENKAAMQKMAAKGSKPQKPQGPPPGKGTGSSASSESEKSSSSKSTDYDVMDLNKDGTVTIQEKFKYQLKLIEAKAEKEKETRKTYDQSGKLNQVIEDEAANFQISI